MNLSAYLPENAWDEIPSLCSQLEQLGVSRVWASEIAHDSLLPLMLAASSTKTLGVATGVAIAFGRTPMALAMAAWDLHRYSRGRFVLGLGTQVKPHVVRRWGGIWEAPLTQLRETTDAIRAIWRAWQDGEPLNYRGRFFKLTLMTPTFNPGPNPFPPPEIAYAGVNEGLCKLAGEQADLFLVHTFNSPEYVKQVVRPAIEAGEAKAGRKVGSVRVVTPVMVATGATAEAIAESRKALRAQIAFYASTPSYRVIMDTHGLGEVADRLRKMASVGEWDAMTAQIDDSIEQTFALVGSYEDVGRQLRMRFAGIADEVTTALFIPASEQAAAWSRVAAAYHAGA